MQVAVLEVVVVVDDVDVVVVVDVVDVVVDVEKRWLMYLYLGKRFWLVNGDQLSCKGDSESFRKAQRSINSSKIRLINKDCRNNLPVFPCTKEDLEYA